MQINSEMRMSRSNNFDLLRLIFASMVVLYHCHDLSRNPTYFWIPYVTSSRLAVEGFFVMSGCLIVRSYDQDPDLKDYLQKRGRRILPAYWAALIFSLILGACFTSLRLGTFLRSPSTWKYFLATLTFANFLHPALPGLFAKNPVMPSVNGALWTIKIEIMFYLLVPAIVKCCTRFGRWQTLCAIFLLSVAYRTTCDRLNSLTLAIQLPGQLCFFAVGALIYFYYHWFKTYRHYMWVLAGVCYGLSLGFECIAFRAIGIGLGVMCVGLLLPPFRWTTKYGDFSYGIYVFHFPVIQTFVALGIVATRPVAALGLIYFTVGILAVVSWYLVEKPLLKSRRSTPRIDPASA